MLQEVYADEPPWGHLFGTQGIPRLHASDDGAKPTDRVVLMVAPCQGSFYRVIKGAMSTHMNMKDEIAGFVP